ncbi:hypothetical protein B7463_g6919, partial [Scytalidium lignicola]
MLVADLLVFAFSSTAVAGVLTPQAWVTSSDGVYNLSSYEPPTKGVGHTTLNSTWALQVDDTTKGHKQVITGFGAAVTDAVTATFDALNPIAKAEVLAELFTTFSRDGVGFSLLRHTIGSSDLSPDIYSYDNVTNPDPELRHFNLEPEGNAQVDWIRAFKLINPSIKLLGSVWAPPGWMQLDHVMVGTNNNNSLNMRYAESFGQYFVKYIEAFNRGGVEVDAITIQNEPLNSNAGYPTMVINATQSTDLIQNYVGPALKKARLNTAVWAYDHNTDAPWYPQTVLDGAGDYVNTVAWHCYATNNSWDVLTQFHQANPNAIQYMTECWTSPTNTWYSTADFVMGPLQNWASGSIAWTMASSTTYGPHLPGGCTTCRGLVSIDIEQGTYVKTLDYYLIGQFSRFIPRGAIALNTTGSYDFGGGAKLEAQAFVNPDQSRTVVIQNNFGNGIYVTVTMGSGEVWKGPVYGKSLTTWVLPPAKGKGWLAFKA